MNDVYKPPTAQEIANADTLMADATRAHEAGRLDEAKALYLEALNQSVPKPEAEHGLGWLLVQQGDWKGALPRFARAIRLRPWEPEFWISQFEAYLQLGQVEAVHRLLHRARENGLAPARAEEFEERLRDHRTSVLAAAVVASGKPAQKASAAPASEILALRSAFLERRFEDARQQAQHLLKRYPLAPFGWRVLALVTPIGDDAAFAMQVRRIACDLDPEGADVAMNLALALHDLGRLDEADATYRRVLLREPKNLRALVNLGLLLNAKNDPTALDYLRQARTIGTDDFRVALALGGYLRDHNRPEEAIPLLEEALLGKPDSYMAAATLSVCFLAVGRHEESAALFRTMAESDIDDLYALGIMLFVGTHLRDVGADELFGLHARFGEIIEAEKPAPPPFFNDPSPERRLRLGFVSGDYRSHAMASFVTPLWAGLDRQRFSIHAYSNHTTDDTVTAELRALADEWCLVTGLSDEAMADRIRKDGIDVLVDLSGHTAFHRLGVFALKPAPIQLSWGGYPATTGLSRMDYYLADTTYAPPGQLDGQFSEKLLRISASASFQPAPESPAVAKLPSGMGRPFTFGSFNRMSKVTPATLDLWGRVLAAVEGSRLVVGAADEPNQKRLQGHLAALSIDPERLSFLPQLGMSQYLAAHEDVDLLLDTAPYAGGTTTCHGIWMGVPTLTRAGETLPTRTGAAIMGRLGLWSFVTESDDAFVKAAIHWAVPAQRDALAELRDSMRERFSASSLGDPAPAIHGFEDGVSAAWSRWCSGLSPAPLIIPPRSS